MSKTDILLSSEDLSSLLFTSIKALERTEMEYELSNEISHTLWFVYLQLFHSDNIDHSPDECSNN